MSDVDLSGGKPDESLNPNEVKTLQTYTEASIRKQIAFPVQSAWDLAQNSLLVKLIGGIGQAIHAGITGAANTVHSIFSGIFSASREVYDGQLELNDRQDLMNPLLDKGNFYCTQNDSGNMARHGQGWLPFKLASGPYKGVHPREDGTGVVLESLGWWDFDLICATDWTAWPDQKEVRVECWSDDEKLWARKTYRSPGMTGGVETISLSGTFVVPRKNFSIRVWAISNGGRGWLGGNEWTSMNISHLSYEYKNDPSGKDAEIIDLPPVKTGDGEQTTEE